MRKKSLLIFGSMAVFSVIAVVYGQTAQRTPGTAAPAPTTAQRAATQPVGAAQRKLLDQYCVACHNDDTASGGLMLDTADLAQVSKDPERFEKVVRKLRAGMMPPTGIPRPDKATYQALILWLENELDRNATPYAPAPGLHRMNRVEYANAIRDLLGLEIDPAKYLPSDDSSSGFDNMAGILGISSTLVEAYVSAAGKISRLAIGEAASPSLTTYRVPEDSSQDYHVEGLPFLTRGGMVKDHIFPSDGEYVITVLPMFADNMAGSGFGSVPCEKLAILLDGERLQLMDWAGGGRGGGGNCGGGGGGGQRGGAGGGAAAAGAAPGNANAAGGQAAGGQGGRGGRGGQPAGTPPAGAPNAAEAAPQTANAPAAGGQPAQPAPAGGGRGGGGGMRVRVKIAAGQHTVGATFLATNFAPIPDLEQHFLRSTLQTGPTPGYTFFPHIGSIRIEGPYNAVAPKDSPSRRMLFVCNPTSPADETACAQKIVSTLATRAYRHPATPEEVSGLMTFYADARKEGNFDHGIEMVLQRVLAAPRFVYRLEVEPATAKEGQLYRISDLELASRLSFFLWSSAPDDRLITLAGQGRLKDPVVLQQQVQRMLQDPRAEALAVNFAGQWLNLRGMEAVGPLPMKFPNFDDPLRQAMRREVELLFDNIVRKDRSVIELLTADYTFVNERLAKHYGIPNIYGSQFRQVTLGPNMDMRRGLLGKAALLTTTSKPEGTNPPKRGNWIMTYLLGVPAPDPPPNVPPLPARVEDARGNKRVPTMREKFLQHRVRADCIQCHGMMDPIAFSLENFDAIGTWRLEDEGNPIDASSVFYDGTKVDGPAGLRNWLVGYSDQFVRVTAEKLLTYALGRRLDSRDMPAVRAIVRDAGRSNNRFSALVMGVVQSKTFQNNMKVQQTSIQKTGQKEGN